MEVDGGLYTLIFSTDKAVVIDCQSGEVSTKQTVKNLSEKAKLTLLLQPEKFIVRNQLLSDLISIDQLHPELCISPTEAIIRLQKHLNNRPVSLDLAYFSLLNR